MSCFSLWIEERLSLIANIDLVIRFYRLETRITNQHLQTLDRHMTDFRSTVS
jgi:precorrin-3B methylase